MKIYKRGVLAVLMCAAAVTASANSSNTASNGKLSAWLYELVGISTAASQEDSGDESDSKNTQALSNDRTSLPDYCKDRPDAAGCSQTR